MSENELINESLIKLNLTVNTKKEVLKAISNIVYEEGRVLSAQQYYQGLVEREDNSTTGFGDGIAIPHAKIKEVIKPTISIIKLNSPVEWKAMDGKPVHLIIALAVPDSQEGTMHLQLLAKLSESLMEEEFTNALLSAETSNDIYKIINSIF